MALTTPFKDYHRKDYMEGVYNENVKRFLRENMQCLQKSAVVDIPL